MRKKQWRFAALFLALTLLIVMFPVIVRASGEEWIEISNAAGLSDISSNLSGKYRLAADIDLTGINWTPIGSDTTPFTGIFDGNTNVIRNLSITDTTKTNNGLFSVVGAGGEIRNLGIEGANITAADNSGILAGTNNGMIRWCYTKGSVSGANHVGGLAGQNTGTIRNSCSQAAVIGKDYFGGLAGVSTGTVENCYVSSALTQSVFINYLEFNKNLLNGYIDIPHKEAYTGNQFTLEAWFQWDRAGTADVNFIMGKGYEQFEIHTGGGSGENGLRFIPIANNKGDSWIDVNHVIQPGWFHVAAVYDYDDSTHEAAARVYINGAAQELYKGGTPAGKEVKLSRAFNTLGFGKIDWENPSVENNLKAEQNDINIGRRTDESLYFDGKISDVRFWNIARTEEEIKRDKDKVLTGTEPGLAGYWRLNEASGDAVDSSSNHNNGILEGDVTRTSEAAAVHKGGLIGQNTGTVTNSLFDSEVSGQSDTAGTPKSTAEMKLKSAYVGWDFTDIWGLESDNNGGYPYLLPIVHGTELSAASVNIAAPTAGGDTQQAASVNIVTNNPDYTVTNVVWNEELTEYGDFKAGQVYTATITLTSKNGKEFQTEAFTPVAATAASVGTTVTNGVGVGNIVTFTVTFQETAPKTLSGIQVSTQPTRMIYTAGTDDVLSLDGMVVTETFNDGSHETVLFAGGIADGFTASPANGTTLTTAYEYTNVTVTHTASGCAAQTNKLTVGNEAGSTVDLSQWTGSNAIIVTAGTSAVITGSRSNTTIICGEGVALTLDNVTITNTNIGYSPVTFTGDGNTLTVTGTNSVIGSEKEPGINIAGANLRILGTGELNATGGSTTAGYGAPGIGSKYNQAGGCITIESGTINATAGSSGRGYKSKFGEGICAEYITIDGGTVTARGKLGPGIGGGPCTRDSAVTILGGTVTATGNSYAPGIGCYSDGETRTRITISGGRVIASSTTLNPGIGSNVIYTIPGSILLTGGEIFVRRGNIYEHDIGKEDSNTKEWTFEIEGTAALFMKNDSYLPPVTTTHTHNSYPVGTSNVYGIDIPADWTASFGAFLSLPTLSYDTNGGGGSAPASVTQLAGTDVTIGQDSGLTRANCTFAGWNTAADGSGTAYQPGDRINFGNDDITLHAQWNIAAADISGLTAPAVGAVPVTVGNLTAGHAEYTVTGLTWQNSDGTAAEFYNGKFKAGQGYKSVIELTAKADVMFWPLTPTTNAGTAGEGTISSNIAGNKLTFILNFDPTEEKAVTGIVVKTQPADLIYTEGEELDLAGLAVNLAYNDGSTREVMYADFEAYDIITEPVNGTTMAAITYNEQPVTVSCNGKTAATASLTVSLPPPPGVPAILSASAGDGKVTLFWSEVAGTLSYKIYSSTSSAIDYIPIATVLGTESDFEATGLTNGTACYFVVTAVGAGGESEFSAEVSATPYTIPGAPANVTAAAGNNRAEVSFAPPTDNGGSPITGYIVTSSPGNITAEGSGTTIAVTGLSNGTSYTFSVTAVNAAGTGPVSTASNAVIPYDPSNGDSGGSDTSAAATTPAQAVNTGIDILVNGKTVSAGDATTTQEGDKSITTVVVDDKKIEERLASEGVNAIVTIPVPAGADISAGQLNGQTIKNMELKEAVLEINTGLVTYSIPASQINIDAVSEHIGKQVELRDISVCVKISEPTAETVTIVESTASNNNYQIVVKPVEFEITCSNGDKTVEVFEFNAYVERLIAIPEGIDPSSVTTGIILNSDGSFSHVPTIITVIGGKYYAKINSLTNSIYSVISSPKTFADVENHWAKEAVNDMASRLVIGGGTDGAFSPDNDITRAEFASIVIRALGLMRPGIGKDVFDDVERDDLFFDAISIAHECGIISGYGNGRFGPQDTITREQAMAMIARAMKITGLPVEFESGEEKQILADFGDTVYASGWSKPSIASCIKAELVHGINGKLIAPVNNMTRAEAAVIVRRLLQKSRLI